MNKKLQLLALILILSVSGFAQVGIGTTSPDASAALDVSATDKGFLMPRMTTAQKTAIVSPAMGLQVYDTDTKSTWTYNGTAWVEGDGGPGKFIDGSSADIAYYQDRVGIGRDDFSTVHKLFVESINFLLFLVKKNYVRFLFFLINSKILNKISSQLSLFWLCVL